MEQGACGVGTLCEPFFFMNNVKIFVFFFFFLLLHASFSVIMCFTHKRRKEMKRIVTHIVMLLAVVLLLPACSVDNEDAGQNQMNDYDYVNTVTEHFEASWTVDQQEVDTATVHLARNMWQAEMMISRLPHAWLLAHSAVPEADRQPISLMATAPFVAATSLEGYGSSNGLYYSLAPQVYRYQAMMGQREYTVEVELKDMNVVATMNKGGEGVSRISVVMNVGKITCQSGDDLYEKSFDTQQSLILNTTKKL